MIVSGLVLWVDPGAPSGVAFLDTRTWVFESYEMHMLELGNRISKKVRRVSAIGWEAFTIRPGTSQITKDTSAPEVIGMLRWLAHHYNIHSLPPQQPDARMLGNIHLKTVGWYNPGLDDANSAGAHMLSWLLSTGTLPPHLLSKIVDDVSEDIGEVK